MNQHLCIKQVCCYYVCCTVIEVYCWCYCEQCCQIELLSFFFLDVQFSLAPVDPGPCTSSPPTHFRFFPFASLTSTLHSSRCFLVMSCATMILRNFISIDLILYRETPSPGYSYACFKAVRELASV